MNYKQLIINKIKIIFSIYILKLYLQDNNIKFKKLLRKIGFLTIKTKFARTKNSKKTKFL